MPQESPDFDLIWSRSNSSESDFQDWYAGQSSSLGLSPDPDDPLHFYDYRAAYKSGAVPKVIPEDGLPHWPSEFKLPGHPNLIVGGRDTRTGKLVDPPQAPSFDALWGGPEKGPGFVAPAKDVGRQALQGLARFGTSVVRRAGNLGQAGGETFRGQMREFYSEQGLDPGLIAEPRSPVVELGEYLKAGEETYKPPTTTAGAVTSLAVPVAAEGLSYIAGGGGIRKLTGMGAKAAAPVVQRGLRGLGQRLARGTGRAAADAATVAPLDIATAFTPEETSSGAFGALLATDKGREIAASIGLPDTTPETLTRWSQDPKKAALFEVAFGFGADLALRGIAGTVAAPVRAAAEQLDVTPGVERAIGEFGADLGQRTPAIPEPERLLLGPGAVVTPAPSRALTTEEGVQFAKETARQSREARGGPPFVPEPSPAPVARTIEPGVVEGLDDFSVAWEAAGRDKELLGELRRGATEAGVEVRAPSTERLLPGPDEAGGPLLRGPGEAGGALPEVTAALGRAGASAAVGGVVGAKLDDEDPVRGAMWGAGVSAAMGAAIPLAKRAAPVAPQAYLQDSAVRQVLGTTGPGPAASKAGLVSRLTAKAGEVNRKLYTRIIDEAAPLKEAGRQLEGSERLAHEAARARGYKGAALSRLQNNFQPVVDIARGHEDGIVALSKAERAIELLDAGLEKTDVPRETLEETVRTLSAVPEVRAGVDALRGYYRSLLDYKLENGVISTEQFEAIVKGGQNYVPFLREVEEGISAGTVQFAPDGTLKSGATGIRRMGKDAASSRTVDPFRQAIDDTLEAERRVSKQRVTNMFAEIVDTNPEAAEAMGVRFVDAATAGRRGARVTPVNVAGERRWMEIADDEIYNSFASFDPYIGNIFTRTLSHPKTWLREGTTSLPDFAIANGIRDNVMAGIQYPFAGRSAAAGTGVGAAVGAVTAEEGERLEGAVKGGLSGLGLGSIAPHVARTLDAMRDILGSKLGGNPEVYQEWLREGGGGFGFYPRDKKGAKRLLAEMRKEGIDPADIVSPRKWWGTLQAINRVVEEAPRVARFKYLKDQGADAAAAVAGSRDISLDFARIGAHTKGISSMTAFFNAQLQGWDKVGRLLKEPKTWATGAAMITAPSIGLWLVNKDNPEYWDRPQWERNLFWLVPKGEGEKGFWRIPKPFEIGFIFGSVPERILDYAYKKDPEALQFAMRDMLSQYGSAALPIPTGVEPIIENIADYSFFRGRPIDPKQFENLPPELQYDDRTSTAAIEAGRALGASPSKIENIVRGVGGSLASEMLNVTTELAKKFGLDDRPENLDSSIPLLRRFETSEVRWGERELALRRKIRQGEQTFNAVKEYAQNGEVERAREYAREHMDELKRYSQLRVATKLLDDARDARQQIQQSDMEADAKREAIILINERVAQVSEALTSATLRGGG